MLTKKRKFNIMINDVNDNMIVSVNDNFEIRPDQLEQFKHEYFNLIDTYEKSVL